ncbi:unnamed protein product, partial [Polarella glacialis]
MSLQGGGRQCLVPVQLCSSAQAREGVWPKSALEAASICQEVGFVFTSAGRPSLAPAENHQQQQHQQQQQQQQQTHSHLCMGLAVPMALCFLAAARLRTPRSDRKARLAPL